MIAPRSLCRIVALIGLLSCCWSAGANVIPTGAPVVTETAAPAPSAVTEPTVAPAAPLVAHTTVVPATGVPTTIAPETNKGSTGNHAAAGVATAAPTVAAAPLSTNAPVHPAVPVTHPAALASEHLTTLAPHHVIVSTVHPNVTVHAANNATTAVVGAPKEVCTGFCDYIKPICESLKQISAKQLFKIQTQFKQFVQKTNGKMSLCFVDHYSVDPTFKAISHEDLSNICASRNKLDASKGSFQAFQTCASNHWDPELDKDLAVIKEARANSTTHQHPKSETVAANIEHDEEELSMISEVVNKVLGQGGKLNEKNSDVKVIDVSGKTTVAPAAPIINGTAHGLPIVVSTAAPSHKSLLNDPNNTVMVFVDDKTTPAPKVAHVNATNVHVVVSTTIKPVINSTVSHNESRIATLAPANATTIVTTPLPVVSTKAPALNGTTIKPVHSVNITTTVGSATTLKPTHNVSTTSVPAGTTIKPVHAVNTTTNVVLATTLKPVGTVSTTSVPAGTTSMPVVTTKSPATTTAPATSNATSSTSAPTKAAATTTVKATEAPTTTAKPTLKPIETLEQILKRQEKEKQALDDKLKAERTKAINKLKKQDNNSHAADARIHQLEHERQMSIDPIGHTIKHQQYEAIKQQKAKSGN